MENLERVGTFCYHDRLDGGDVAEGLGRFAGRPGNRQAGGSRRVAQPNRLDEAVAAKAGVVADCAVDRTCLTVLGFEVDLDLGAERRAIRFGADQLDLQPMVALARVLKQRVVRLVSGRCAAELDKQVKVAVTIPVGERNTVALLEVAGAGAGGDILEGGAPSTFLQHEG